jgi:anhydro-N-acetylmuramic acid kinase
MQAAFLIFALMVYKVIGLMSGSSLDGLDLAYVLLQERVPTSTSAPRTWEFHLLHSATYPYDEIWRQRLASAPGLSALDYQLLHVEYGAWLGEQVLRFIEEHGLHYNVQLIASHGHTAFHWPARRMTAQLGDGAAIAAITRINVVSDLRAMDLALGGQGAPIVPIGERLLLPGYEFFLNLGGIANISRHAVKQAATGGGGSATESPADAGSSATQRFAFDVCPANRVLNTLVEPTGLAYDKDGELAATGRVDNTLLRQLDALPYYAMPYPKSLANEFGTGTVLPLIRTRMDAGLALADALRTYVEHIAGQINRAVSLLAAEPAPDTGAAAEPATRIGAAQGSDPGIIPARESGDPPARLLATGGGAHNRFLVSRLRDRLEPKGVEIVVPENSLVDYKEALVMALIGVLRWREENNVLASVTGASRDSIGGAVWIGQEV